MARFTASTSLSPATPRLTDAARLDLRQLPRIPADYADDVDPFAARLRTAIRRHGICFADFLAAAAASGAVLWPADGLRGSATAIVIAAFAAATYHAVGGYQDRVKRFGHSTLDELPAIVVLAALLTLLVTMIHPVLAHGRTEGWKAAELWVAFALALGLGRTAARALASRIIGAERCLVIGTITEARRIQRRMNASGAKVHMIGIVPLSQLRPDHGVEDLREALATVVADVHADRVVVATSGTDQDDVTRLVKVARLEGLEITVCSPLLDAAAAGSQVHQVGGMTLLTSDPAGSGRVAACMSRCADVAVSAFLLLLLTPVFVAISLAVKLDSPGPVFVRQMRVGRHGVNFQIMKFRSVVGIADEQKASSQARSEVGPEMFKPTNNPRSTRVGRLLRRSSLDGLPQLVNVLRGDMTLVGPRPLVVDEDALIEGVGRGRLQRTPGLTGPWQVMPERVTQAEMLEIDYSYVTTRSLWSDAKILFRTALYIMRNGNV